MLPSGLLLALDLCKFAGVPIDSRKTGTFRCLPTLCRPSMPSSSSAVPPMNGTRLHLGDELDRAIVG